MAKQFERATISDKRSYSYERNLLNAEFDQEYLVKGTVISFEDIAIVAKLSNPTDKELRAVLNSWRKELKTKNIFTGVSYRDRYLWVKVDVEMANNVKTRINSVFNSLAETTHMILNIDTEKLSESQKKQLELDKRVADGIQLAQSKKQITAFG